MNEELSCKEDYLLDFRYLVKSKVYDCDKPEEYDIEDLPSVCIVISKN